MPDLNQLPIPEYQGGQPYHFEYDNLPLKTLARRDEIINNAVDSVSKILSDCNGTAGTLSNRLDQSIDDDGSLLTMAVDESFHNIAAHLDGYITVDTIELDYYISLGFPDIANPVGFVRMLESERIKLSTISDEATNVTVSIETNSNTTISYSEPFTIAPSSSIQWELVPDTYNTVQAIVAMNNPHLHYYGQLATLIINQTYSIPMSQPYISGSLRVYINGVCLNETTEIYYPARDENYDLIWSLNKFTSNYTNGVFVLQYDVQENDVITVDYDIAMT
jgi:hypothetical protein